MDVGLWWRRVDVEGGAGWKKAGCRMKRVRVSVSPLHLADSALGWRFDMDMPQLSLSGKAPQRILPLSKLVLIVALGPYSL
jgi:hypothetical protein